MNNWQDYLQLIAQIIWIGIMAAWLSYIPIKIICLLEDIWETLKDIQYELFLGNEDSEDGA